MSTLLQYLAALANDPAAQQTFATDPESALASSGLSEHDKAVLRTRNNGLIQATVGAQATAAMIYASQQGTQPAMIYAPQNPSMIYAPPVQSPPPQLYYAILIPMPAGAPHPSMIYSAAQPPMIYAPQPAMIYAQPSMIYAQPAMIYAAQGKPDDPQK